MPLIPISERLERLTDSHPDKVALTLPARDGTELTVTWAELDRRANHCAAVMAAAPQVGEVVIIALPTGVDHVVATLAAWKLGLVVVPLDPDMPGAELRALVALAEPRLCVSYTEVDSSGVSLNPRDWRDGRSGSRPPRPATEPRSASATGGSSGIPRIIYRRRGWMLNPDHVVTDADTAMGLRAEQVQLVTTALFHTGFSALYHGLALDHHIILMTRFVPRLVLDAVERYSVQAVRLVPTMMKMLLHSGGGLAGRDLSSLESVLHGTAPCPAEVKRAWLRAVPPATLFETYGSQEQVGIVQIRGDEWLRHPGSVGKPDKGTVVIVTADNAAAAPHEVGRIHLRRRNGGQPPYLGPGPELVEWGEGYLYFGDVGYLDEEGYLFVLGRTDRTSNVGGVTVHHAEVEATLLASPLVSDVLVVGRDHDLLGQALHALVVPADADRTDLLDLVDDHCRTNLVADKVPSSFEFVGSLPRNEAGKIRYR